MIDKELKKADEERKKIEKELEALILARKEKQKKLRKAIANKKNLLEKKLIKDIKALGYKTDITLGYIFSKSFCNLFIFFVSS